MSTPPPFTVQRLSWLRWSCTTALGLSESGTRKYLDWATRFPYIFEIDTGRLK